MSPLYYLTIIVLTASSITSGPLPNARNDIGTNSYVNSISDNTEKQLTESVEYQAKHDVLMTIDQVQQMLEQDPSLPRLTKGEIEDLFEQVTKEEYERSLQEGDMNRANHMRALMLVLPYNTDNSSNENLQDLFNRPPITKVVPTSIAKPQKPLKTVLPPSGKVEIISIANPNPTTYKPTFRLKTNRKTTTAPITTYRPSQQNYAQFAIVNDPYLTSEIPLNLEFEEGMKPTRFSSHYNAKQSNFKNDRLGAAGQHSDKKKSDLDDVLKSLGFVPRPQPRKRYKFDDRIDTDLEKPVISSLIKQDRVSVEEFQPVAVNIAAADFKKSLVPRAKSNDFVAFKPLQIEEDAYIEPELEEYLKKFGIVNESFRSRSQKSLKISPPIIEKAEYHENQDQNGPIKRIDRDIDEDMSSNIYNPTKSDVHNSKDLIELQKLLNNLRELEKLNISLTEETFDKLDLTNYNLSDALLAQQGPNPNEHEDYKNNQLKNEIKRQNDDNEAAEEPTRFNLDVKDSELAADVKRGENTDNESLKTTTEGSIQQTLEFSTESSTELSTESSTEVLTTTEESRNGAISDLEDSFGGPDPVTEETLPPPRKNGFYFLADINSFLEVGDGDEKVVVRFNPQIGDPSRFLPVIIPSPKT